MTNIPSGLKSDFFKLTKISFRHWFWKFLVVHSSQSLNYCVVLELLWLFENVCFCKLPGFEKYLKSQKMVINSNFYPAIPLKIGCILLLKSSLSYISILFTSQELYVFWLKMRYSPNTIAQNTFSHAPISSSISQKNIIMIILKLFLSFTHICRIQI